MLKKPGRELKQRKPPVVRAGKAQSVRIRLVLLMFMVSFGGIAYQVISLQVFPDERFAALKNGHVGTKMVERSRGDIVDRRGGVLATNRIVHTLNVNPSKFEGKDPAETVQYLKDLVDLDESELLKLVTKRDNKGELLEGVAIERFLTDEDVKRIGDLSDAPEPHGLFFEWEYDRLYPEGRLAAQVLGFVFRYGNKDGGGGAELRYNEYLRSNSGFRVMPKDGKGFFLGYRTQSYEPATGGARVHLTLDKPIQYALEAALASVIEKFSASHAMGIVMEVQTGNVLALATIPSYDPNMYPKYNAEARKNRAVMDLFDPGSIFKIVTVAAALELGIIDWETPIDCMNGTYYPYGIKIKDTHPKKEEPFWKCFAMSSNIAIVKVAAWVGPDNLEKWISRFGFDRKTMLGLPGESDGFFRPRRPWSTYSRVYIPMGHEVSVSLLQIARAMNAIASGGYLVEPRLVSKIVSVDNEILFDGQQPKPERIMSEETAAIMRELLYRVVAYEEGTGKNAAIKPYRVGGKTSTAQIAEAGGYSKTRYTAIFGGFAPLDNPRLTCVIVVSEPEYGEGRHYGGVVCAPVFSEVMKKALVRLDVPEDPMPEEDWHGGRNGTPGRNQFKDLDLSLLEPVLGKEVDGLELTQVQTDRTLAGPRLPDFSGMTLREAKAILVELLVPSERQGAGRVILQDPPAGTILKDVLVCKLILSNR